MSPSLIIIIILEGYANIFLMMCVYYYYYYNGTRKTYNLVLDNKDTFLFNLDRYTKSLRTLLSYPKSQNFYEFLLLSYK